MAPDAAEIKSLSFSSAALHEQAGSQHRLGDCHHGLDDVLHPLSLRGTVLLRILAVAGEEDGKGGGGGGAQGQGRGSITKAKTDFVRPIYSISHR